MQKENKGLIDSREQNIIASALLLGYNDFYIKSKQNKNDKENPFNIMVYLSSKPSIKPVPAKAVPYLVVNKNAVNQFYFNEFIRNWAKSLHSYMSKISSINAKTAYQGNLKEILYDVSNDYKTEDLSQRLIDSLLKNEQLIELTDFAYMIANQQKVCKLLNPELSKRLSAFLEKQESKFIKGNNTVKLIEKSRDVAKTLGKGQIVNNKLCYNGDIRKELDKIKNGFNNFENK